MSNIYKLLSCFERDGKEETPGTPVSLVNDMLDKLPSETWSDPSKKFLDPACSTGTFLLEIVRRLNKGLAQKIPNQEDRLRHIVENMVYGAEVYQVPYLMTRRAFSRLFNYKFNLFHGNMVEGIEGLSNMKFDVVVMNPPYQIKVGPKKTEPIWQKFVDKTFSEWLKVDGFLAAVHPSGWRAPSGRFKNIQELYLSKELQHLSLHTFEQGRKTFGVGTAYDWLIARNKDSQNIKTKIVDIDDNENEVDLHNWNYIPSGRFQDFKNLNESDPSGKVNSIHSYSAYESRKPHISKQKVGEFRYPVVYTTTEKNGLKCLYSSTRENGHFDKAKVFWTNGGGSYPVLDEEGEYGLTQFAYAIVDDDIEYLRKVKQALEADDFIDLMKYVKFESHRYNRKVISEFKKDFWRDFING